MDVLWVLDRASESEQAAELAGYRWRGRNEWGPLGLARDFINSRLLGPERLLDASAHDNWVLPRWESGDPLDDIFRIWFGSYEASDQGINLERDFAARSTMVRIDPGGPLPVGTSSWVTPILATGNAIEYAGLSPGAGFMVVNPSDPARPNGLVELACLWGQHPLGPRTMRIGSFPQLKCGFSNCWMSASSVDGNLAVASLLAHGWMSG